MALTITKVTRQTEEVISFLNPQLVTKELHEHPLLLLTFKDRRHLSDKIEQFFKHTVVTTSHWNDHMIRYILPDHRSDNKCVCVDFFTEAS